MRCATAGADSWTLLGTEHLAASSLVKLSWSARISARRPEARSRPSRRPGSARETITRCACSGRFSIRNSTCSRQAADCRYLEVVEDQHDVLVHARHGVDQPRQDSGDQVAAVAGHEPCDVRASAQPARSSAVATWDHRRRGSLSAASSGHPRCRSAHPPVRQPLGRQASSSRSRPAPRSTRPGAGSPGRRGRPGAAARPSPPAPGASAAWPRGRSRRIAARRQPASPRWRARSQTWYRLAPVAAGQLLNDSAAECCCGPPASSRLPGHANDAIGVPDDRVQHVTARALVKVCGRREVLGGIEVGHGSLLPW